MLLTCPNCSTRYLVPDASIGVSGRRVRCSQCAHSWFQSAPESLLAAAAPPEPAPAPATPPPPLSWAEDQAARRPVERAEEPPPPPAPEAGFDPFAHAPPFRPRRNPARIRTIIAVTVGLTLLALNVALWMAGGVDSLRAMIASGGTFEPAALLRLERIGGAERRMVEGGHEVLEIHGLVRNPTNRVLAVPDIRAALVNDDGRTLYAWTIPAPVRRLDADMTATFSGVTIDAPREAAGLKLTFLPAAGR